MLKNLPYTWGFLIACLGGMGALSASLHPLNSDEGVILSGAWHLLQGRELYEDSFEYVAPGSYYLIAWGWQLAGSASYALAKILAVLAAAGAALATVFTARLLAGERVSPWPAIVYFAALNGGPLINHNPLFVLPAAWSLYFGVRGLLRDSLRDRLLSGLLCGLAMLFLQHKGAALALSLGAGLLLASPGRGGHAARAGLAFGAAALAPLLVLLHWDPQTLIQSLVVFPMERYLAIQQVDSSLWVGTVLMLAWIAWRVSFSVEARALRLLALVQATLLLTALQRPDSHHLIVVLFPLAAIFPLFLRTWSVPPPARTVPACLSTLVGAGISGLLAWFAFSLFSAFAVQAAKSSGFRQELAGAVAERCARSPYLYAGPFIPGLYFETGKLNVTRYSLLLEHFNTDRQFAQALGDLQAKRPGCAVLLGEIARQFGHTGNNPVEKLLARDYMPAGKVGHASILMLPAGD